MPNIFETSQIVANEGLLALRNLLNMGATVYRGLDREWATQTRKPGQSVTVPTPPTLVARDATDDLAGAGLQTQAVTEGGVLVTLSKHKYVRVAVTDEEMALEVEDLNRQVVTPQIIPLVEQIETDLHQVYLDVPYHTGTAGTTPANLAAIAGCGQVMSENKAPRLPTRYAQIDPAAQAELWPLLAQLKAANPGGMNDALTAAAVGRTGGFDIFENQAVAYHTRGTLDAGATASGTTGASTITIASGGNAKTLVVGDLITIADVVKNDGTPYQFVITELATTNSGGAAAGVKIYPALPGTFSTKAVTVVASHRANLAYTPNAFCLAMARLPLPMGGATGAYATDPESGMSVRVVYDWENLSNVLTVDVLYGVKVLRAEEAVRLLG
jgi:hypothetical protein